MAVQAEHPAFMANARLPDQHLRAIDPTQLVGEKVMDGRSSAKRSFAQYSKLVRYTLATGRSRINV